VAAQYCKISSFWWLGDGCL